MNRNSLAAGLAITALVVAVPADAQFLAADLLYVPGAAHTDGEGDSQWRTDLFITNVEEEVDVDIAIVYIQTGLVSNSGDFVGSQHLARRLRGRRVWHSRPGSREYSRLVGRS